MTRVLPRLSALALMLCCTVTGAVETQPVEARTTDGDRVLLHPNGRWVFVDQAKAAAAAKIADTFPENQTRPIEAQGGLLGVGRVIMPGDKDYNRGSLSGKGR